MSLMLGLNVDGSAMFKAIAGAIDAFEHPTQDEIGAGAEEAQRTYMDATQARFIAQAMGGGSWAELTPFTQRDRKQLGYDPKRPILIRSHVLFNALFPGQPGNLHEVLADRVRDGIGGGDAHPGYGRGATTTIAAIAAAHQSGTSIMPARPILIDPQPDTLDSMQTAVARAVESMWARVTTP